VQLLSLSHTCYICSSINLPHVHVHTTTFDMKLYHVLQYCIIIIPPLCHFTILGQKTMQNMPLYYTVEQGKIPTEEEWQNGQTKRNELCLVYVLWPWLSNRQTFYWNGLLNRTYRNFGINDTLMVSLVLFIVNAGVGIRSSKDLTRTSMYWFSTPDTYNVDSNSILSMVYDLMSKKQAKSSLS